jgi:hypothetical protein
MCTSVVPATQEIEAGGLKVAYTLCQKQNKNKRTEGVAQVVEHLLSMCVAWGSVLSTTRDKAGQELAQDHLSAITMFTSAKVRQSAGSLMYMKLFRQL